MAKNRRRYKLPIIKSFVIIVISFLVFTTVLSFGLKAAGLGLSVWDIYAQSLPKTDRIDATFPEEFFVEKKSYFEKQGKGQCGGYSSAYVLRCLGKDISGSANYEQLGHKFANGYIMPQALLDVFHDYGYKAKLYRGELEQLKARLAEGTPIIVLFGDGIKWQHYVTVVGYDKNGIYLYDSNKGTDNLQRYNRTLKSSEFVKQWENGIPLFEKIYFIVQ